MSGLPSAGSRRLALHGALDRWPAPSSSCRCVWVVAAGFRTQISLLTGEFLFTPVLTNFAEVLFSKTSDFLLNYRNSLVVGVAQHRALPCRRRRWRPGRCTACAGPAGCRTSSSAGRCVFHMIPPVALAGAWYTMMRHGRPRQHASPASDPRAHRAQPADGALADGRVRARSPARARGGGADRRRLDAGAAVAGGAAADRARARRDRRSSPSSSAGTSSPSR